jgi:hypothetical protein
LSDLAPDWKTQQCVNAKSGTHLAPIHHPSTMSQCDLWHPSIIRTPVRTAVYTCQPFAAPPFRKLLII